MRDLETEATKIIAPPKSAAASRRSFMQIAAGASALLATGGIALTASRASAATDPDSIVPRNEEIIRRAYALAEVKPNPDLQGWIDAFTPDGTFTDESAGITYRGKDLAAPVTYMATAFPDIHRELYRVYSVGDMVIVELSINGTNTGPTGSNPPNGRKMRAPCCDVFNLKDGKIVSFHCYPLVLSPSSWTGA
jgi:ketosteroid isomerase-like protein